MLCMNTHTHVRDVKRCYTHTHKHTQTHTNTHQHTTHTHTHTHAHCLQRHYTHVHTDKHTDKHTHTHTLIVFLFNFFSIRVARDSKKGGGTGIPGAAGRGGYPRGFYFIIFLFFGGGTGMFAIAAPKTPPLQLPGG
jgi:hypothetical protein